MCFLDCSGTDMKGLGELRCVCVCVCVCVLEKSGVAIKQSHHEVSNKRISQSMRMVCHKVFNLS